MQIADSSFLVTGGSGGLGAACVRALVERGARVLIADVNHEAGGRLAAELGDRAKFLRTDVIHVAGVQTAVAAAAELAPLRGVINCAGILRAGRVVGKEGPHDLAVFSSVVQVNLVGTFNVVRLAAAAMAQNEPNAESERGLVINTASVAAFDGQIGQAAYAASKAGVAGMTLPIARELARFGIRVVAIAPGAFETEMMAGISDEARSSLVSQVPFPPRLGRPEEFAALAMHIIGNPMLNGTVIRLDGALRMAAK